MTKPHTALVINKLMVSLPDKLHSPFSSHIFFLGGYIARRVSLDLLNQGAVARRKPEKVEKHEKRRQVGRSRKMCPSLCLPACPLAWMTGSPTPQQDRLELLSCLVTAETTYPVAMLSAWLGAVSPSLEFGPETLGLPKYLHIWNITRQRDQTLLLPQYTQVTSYAT